MYVTTLSTSIFFPTRLHKPLLPLHCSSTKLAAAAHNMYICMKVLLTNCECCAVRDVSCYNTSKLMRTSPSQESVWYSVAVSSLR